MSDAKQTNETKEPVKEYTPGIVTKNQLPGYEVIGIKKAPSKNGDRIYTTYMCRKPWSDYEVDNAEILCGVAVEEVTTTEDFPINLGDIVEFYYGKAIRDWQPVTAYKLIKAATPFDEKK